MPGARSSPQGSPVPLRESRQARRERASRIARNLARAYPDAWCALHYESPWQLLVATILSAQCTDEMVNRVTPGLFEEYPDPESLAQARRSRLESLIRKTGFFSQKAKALQGCARGVLEEFEGKVPEDMESLTTLPGVGRKTASVVLGTAFRQPAIFVDTHVRRVTTRLGLTRNKDPGRIEADLRELLPPKDWTMFCHRLIHHGRQVCKARTPVCDACPVGDLCPRIGVTEAKRSSKKGKA